MQLRAQARPPDFIYNVVVKGGRRSQRRDRCPLDLLRGPLEPGDAVEVCAGGRWVEGTLEDVPQLQRVTVRVDEDALGCQLRDALHVALLNDATVLKQRCRTMATYANS